MRVVRFKRSWRWLVVVPFALTVGPQARPSSSFGALLSGAPNSYLIGAQSMNGLSISGNTSYRDAIKVFGPLQPPNVSATFPPGWCHLRYRGLGLALDFFRLDSERLPGTPRTCEFLSGGTVTSGAWHTRNGLSVGASLRSMLRLFPRAWHTKLSTGGWSGPSGSSVWWLDQSPGIGVQPVLEAYVKHARVVALGIAIVGH
jgi:hypothetical protein